MKIQLTVAYVGFGGNTGGGQYFYSYFPDTIKVNKENETLEFVLSDATDKRFEIDTLVSTDANSQFKLPVLRSDKRSLDVLDVNSKPQLTLVSIVVKDTISGLHISCDPQVLNVPDW